MATNPQQPKELGEPNYEAAPMLGMFLVRQLGTDKKLRRWVEVEYDFHADSAERVVHSILMRHPWLTLLFTVAPGVVLLGTYVAINQIGSYLDSLGFEWIWWVVDNGAIGGFVLLVVQATPPVLLALLVLRLGRRQLQEKIRHHLTTPLCIYCGYNLSASTSSGDTTTCTECGNITPDMRSA